ncbi:DUF2254 domain-containing protein [Streptomyces sp. CC210A]|uniref:DUF2254 domain-containing protein n=1 Tax=Streptomyces sp. CC210A TaxID=2898184 RepID=UPI001F306BA9|nr:DUF2254 domain-containing protein [Streptomyces sp. CC210A]
MRESLRTQLWPLPAAGVVLAVIAGVALPELDKSIGSGTGEVAAYLFGGGAAAARTVLEAIAASLISVTALTFSLTVVALQLASSQYSPRLLRTFSADRNVQVTLALFLATFTYALTVLRTVRTAEEGQRPFVPQASVTVAFVLALASVLALVLFLSHLALELRVETLITRVHHDAEQTVARVFRGHPRAEAGEDDIPEPPLHAVPLLAARSGFLDRVHERALLEAAVEADGVVIVDRFPGSSLIAGTPIGRVWRRDGTPFDRDRKEQFLHDAARAVSTARERTDQQDIAFALRQLTDVAVRALSPGINDPTTAVHALSHSSALLCDLAGRPLGPRLLYDDEHRLRAVLNRPRLSDLLDLAVHQPLRYGAAEPEVLARLLRLLQELAWTVRPEHHALLDGYHREMRTLIGRHAFPATERRRLDALGDELTRMIAPA